MKSKKVTEKEMILSDKSSFIIKEDYKSLRTNISFSLPTKGAKCIVITSSTRSEGKSTNAINLAISYAQIGEKVLLIDSDMRIPTVVKKLGMSVDKGLSDVLIGNQTSEKVIKQSKEYGFDVMGTGTLPPDPTKLLVSGELKQMVTHLKEMYDYIIVDCPPVNLVVDALLWADVSDGYVIVTKKRSTIYKNLNILLEQLKRAGANVLGFLFVDYSRQEKITKYSKKYYYYNTYTKQPSKDKK